MLKISFFSLLSISCSKYVSDPNLTITDVCSYPFTCGATGLDPPQTVANGGFPGANVA